MFFVLSGDRGQGASMQAETTEPTNLAKAGSARANASLQACRIISNDICNRQAPANDTRLTRSELRVPLLVQRFPSYRETVMRVAQRAEVVATKTEEEGTGTNHAILGYFLARSWMPPDPLCQAILIHHDVAAFRDKGTVDGVRNLVGIGHLAKHIQQRWLGTLDDATWATSNIVWQ